MTTLAQPARDHETLLRRAMQIDAAVSFASAATALVAAGPLEAATGIPAALLQPLGAVFLVYASGLAYAATRPAIDRRAAWGFAYLNFSWVALSAAALIFGWLPLNAVGFWLVVAQALLVDLFGVAQVIGLRRSR
jgi:hypothetical protein